MFNTKAISEISTALSVNPVACQQYPMDTKIEPWKINLARVHAALDKLNITDSKLEMQTANYRPVHTTPSYHKWLQMFTSKNIICHNNHEYKSVFVLQSTSPTSLMFPRNVTDLCVKYCGFEVLVFRSVVLNL